MKYRSKFEESIAKSLKKKNINFSYESVKFKYTVEKHYTPDFILPNGIIIEAKGYFTASDRTKMLKVIKDNPYKDIRMLFQNKKNKLNKNSKTTYEEWCIKNNIRYAEKKIPKSWLDE